MLLKIKEIKQKSDKMQKNMGVNESKQLGIPHKNLCKKNGKSCWEGAQP